jgi:hypothetical protein
MAKETFNVFSPEEAAQSRDANRRLFQGAAVEFARRLESRVSERQLGVQSLRRQLSEFRQKSLEEWYAHCEQGFSQIEELAEEQGFVLAPRNIPHGMVLARKNPGVNASPDSVDLLILDADDRVNPITLIDRGFTLGYKRFMAGKPQKNNITANGFPIVEFGVAATLGMAIGLASYGFMGGYAPGTVMGVKEAATFLALALGTPMALGTAAFFVFGVRRNYFTSRTWDARYYGEEALQRIYR